MLSLSTLIAYLAASSAIILAPGPAQALVLARTIGDGKRAGVLTALGLNVGTIVHTLAAALGVSAVLATSAAAFALVKYLGAAYLIYLGTRALTAREQAADVAVPVQSGSAGRAFLKAVITGVFNPKVALFFLAFLPQFVDPQRGAVFAQFLILGLILAALDVLYESALVLVAGTLRGWLARSQRFALWRQRLTGAVLIGLGMRLAFLRRE
jgi:threonine/homoserine/homoserine lactone efflux protein